LVNFIPFESIIAGRDTTAQALSWAIYLLCQNQEKVTKMREEIDREFSSSESNWLNYEQLQKELPYVRAVFSETLRLYPSVPLEIKYAVNADVLPDGTKMKPGEAFVWSLWSMGRLKELWGRDSESFRPERWMEMNNQPSPYLFPAFNAGPRYSSMLLSFKDLLVDFLDFLRNLSHKIFEWELKGCHVFTFQI
jgi:cytochrome P450